jgi:hypothetical protein
MYMLGIDDILAAFNGLMMLAVAVHRLNRGIMVALKSIRIAAILLAAFLVRHGFSHGGILRLRIEVRPFHSPAR